MTNDSNTSATTRLAGDAEEDTVHKLQGDPKAARTHPCDLRKVRDLEQLTAFSRGSYKGRLKLEGFSRAQDGSPVIVCRLRASGLVWSSGRPIPCDTFRLAIALPHFYPLTLPGVRFLDPVPYACHIVHRDCPPEPNLPPDLRDYIDRGHGHCCYMRSSKWTSDAATHNLVVLAWQLSRILTGAKLAGEAVSLNRSARDHFFRLPKGALPLGRPLPLPYKTAEADHGAPGLTGADESEEADIELG